MKKRFGTLVLALILACSLAIPAGASVTEEPYEADVLTEFTTSTGAIICYYGKESVNIYEVDSCVFVNGEKLIDLTEANESALLRGSSIPSATWNLASGSKKESGFFSSTAYSNYKYYPNGSTISYYLNAGSINGDGSDVFGLGLYNASGKYIGGAFHQGSRDPRLPGTGQTNWFASQAFPWTLASGYYYIKFSTSCSATNYTVTFS